jgi:hypothetical protein
MCQFIQRFIRAPVQFPSPHVIAYRFCGFVADCRIVTWITETMQLCFTKFERLLCMSIEVSQSYSPGAKGKFWPLHTAYSSKCLLSVKIAGRYVTGRSSCRHSSGKFPPPKCIFRLVIHTNAEKSKGFFLSAVSKPDHIFPDGPEIPVSSCRDLKVA